MEAEKRKILKLYISDGKFISHHGANVKEFADDFCEGNGWKVKYFPDGSIMAKAYLFHDQKGENSVKFKISRFGYVCLSEIRSGKKTELRRFKLRRWPEDGIIGLSDGWIGERYAYFQDMHYQKFLSDNGINAVRKQDPNHTYTLYQCFSEELGKNVRESIFTDGEIEVIGRSYGRSDKWEKMYPGTFSFEKYEVTKIREATWVVIVNEDFDEDVTKRTLYSLLDTEQLSNLGEQTIINSIGR